MAILQPPTRLSGTPGIRPNFLYMTTTDTSNTVSTPGYLNSPSLEATPLSNGDVIPCLYSVNPQSGVGTFGMFTVAINPASGQITLTPWTAGGATVITPTKVSHIATYTNTSGTLSEDAGTAINGGNIQAGLNGTSGNFVSFPAALNTGSLALQATGNVGNTKTSITNAPMNQTTLITIPDPQGASATVPLFTSPLINGNLLEGTAIPGVVTSSGIPASILSSVIQTQTIILTLSAVQVQNAAATPITILNPSLPGTGFFPIACQWVLVYGGTPFAGGDVAQLQWGNTANAGGTLALNSTVPTTFMYGTTSSVYTQYGVAADSTTAVSVVSGVGLYFSNATGAFTGGTGSTLTIALTYQIVPV